MDISVGHIDVCQICRSSDLQRIIDMGFFSPCDSLLTHEALHRPETTYPLNLMRCRTCGLVQIDFAVEPSLLFHADYPYRSAITDTLRGYLTGMSRHVARRLKLRKGDLVVDIGSNDGTVLQGFKALGMRVLGVEPTRIADIAIANGIDTLNAFFTTELAQEIEHRHGAAALVTATNVFAHVNNLSGLMHGVHRLLKPGGVFINESHCLLDIMDTLQYDSIYHEHLRFYSMRPLAHLFRDYDFSMFDVERIPNYGGSIRVWARKGAGGRASPAVARLRALEESRGLYEDRTYAEFARQMRRSRREIRALVVRLNEKKKVVGIGCPGRAATLLSWCGLTPDLIPYIAEQSSCLKLGLFTPQTHIPVVNEEILFREQPDYALMLSWHYAAPILKSLRSRGLRSKVIVPLPRLKIIDDVL